MSFDQAGLEYELIDHRRTETAGDEATAVGEAPGQVAKTIVLASRERCVRAVLPASVRLDLHEAREQLGDKQARLATEAELTAAYPMYELVTEPQSGAPIGVVSTLDIARALAGFPERHPAS
jgi:prolyl-tRNA editing enzyme YbaK/EbsC (Cys-tRNA(Pro) deacylase)